MTNLDKYINSKIEQPEHCGARDSFKTCPVLNDFICPDRFICKDCEFMKYEESVRNENIL